MTIKLQLQFFYILSIFSTIFASVEHESFLIKSAVFQGLVLDGGDSEHIKIQLYNNSTSQLWNFLPTNRPGLYHIINNQTGKALDVHPNGGLALVTKDKDDVLRQKWSLSLKGRITNAENKQNIDINGGRFAPGNGVNLWGDNGSEAQEFVVEVHNEVQEKECKQVCPCAE